MVRLFLRQRFLKKYDFSLRQHDPAIIKDVSQLIEKDRKEVNHEKILHFLDYVDIVIPYSIFNFSSILHGKGK